MRWPQNAASLVVGRAGALRPGKTYKPMREHALNYLDQLWMLASVRRHANDVTSQVAELKADWGPPPKLLLQIQNFTPVYTHENGPAVQAAALPSGLGHSRMSDAAAKPQAPRDQACRDFFPSLHQRGR